MTRKRAPSKATHIITSKPFGTEKPKARPRQHSAAFRLALLAVLHGGTHAPAERPVKRESTLH